MQCKVIVEIKKLEKEIIEENDKKYQLNLFIPKFSLVFEFLQNRNPLNYFYLEL